MGNTLVESQLNEVQSFLVNTNSKIEGFLNITTLSEIGDEEGSLDYNRVILSNLRRLLVYSEECLDASKVIALSSPFQKAAAEKTLYRIYHQCIEEFFSPKNDAWFEDSRSAYTGKNSIKFHKPVAKSIQNLVQGLEADFQRVREDLEYYETDYRTKMAQSK